MGDVIYLTARQVRERVAQLPPLPPRIPRLPPPQWNSLAGSLVTIGWTLALVTALALAWAPIILAAVWLFRRLHH